MAAQSIPSPNIPSSSASTATPLPMSFILARAIIRDIAPSLIGAMSLDLVRGLARKIKNGTFERDDYEIVKAVCSGPGYRKFKRDMENLETVREGESIAANVSDEKRVSKRAAYTDAAYLEAVADHASRCHPRGGFLAGSRLHWRPVEDEEHADDCSVEKGVKRKRLVRPNDED